MLYACVLKSHITVEMCRDIFKLAWDALCTVCLDLGLAAQLTNEPCHAEVCILS